MNTWPITKARAQLSRVVRMAAMKGPQTVTVRGVPVAVLHAIKKPRKFPPNQTFLEFFAPFKGSGIKLVRRRDLPPLRRK